MNLYTEFRTEYPVQSNCRISYDARCLHRVKYISEFKTEITSQANQVILGCVEYLLNFWVFKNGSDCTQVIQFERVNQIVRVWRRELHKTNLLFIRMHAIGLSIYSYAFLF